MKPNYLKIAFIVVLGFISFNSYSSTKMSYTNIDVLRPAKVSFLADADNLLIVNNTVAQPSHLGHSTRLLNENQRDVDISTDSLSMFLVSALSEEIEKKDFFSTTGLVYESVKSGTYYDTAKYLRSYQVASLCEQYEADVILSLNKLKITDSLEEFYFTDGSYLLTLDAIYESQWSIQYPGKSVVDTVLYTDTVHWENSSYSRRLLFQNFTKRSDALINGALSVGRKFVDRFIPYWEEKDRYFFNSKNKLMEQGMYFVYTKKWNNAIKLWEEALLTNTKDKKLTVHASNNLAVAYEMTGEIDKALGYISAAVENYSNLSNPDNTILLQMVDYQNDLIRRKQDAPLLEKQLGTAD